MKLNEISILKEDEFPSEFPALRRNLKDNEQAKLDELLSQMRQYVEAGELIKAEHDRLKYINNMIERAYDRSVRDKLLAVDHDDRDDAWDELYWVGHPTMANVNGREKKVKAIIKKFGENEFIESALELYDEIKPLAAAFKDLKTKIVKKKAAQVAREKEKADTEKKHLAHEDMQKVVKLLNKVTETLRSEVHENYTQFFMRFVERWQDQYNPDDRKTGYSYFYSQHPTARSLLGNIIQHENNSFHGKESLVDDWQEKVRKSAQKQADQILESFVIKNTQKLGEILTNKNNLKTAKLIDARAGSGVVEGVLDLEFEDGSSFTVTNKVVWSISKLGKVFARFPTTFHNVVLPNGRRLSSVPSEATMKKEFTND